MVAEWAVLVSAARYPPVAILTLASKGILEQGGEFAFVECERADGR
jgi:hypothetical protein